VKRDGQAYTILTQLFDKNNLLISASELQGVVYGYLTAIEEPCFETWVQDINDLVIWSEASEDLRIHLKNLFLAAHLEIIQGSEHMTFISPSEQEPVALQLTAISDWARGCLYGIGLGALPTEYLERSDLEEALNDLTQIAQIELTHTEDHDLQADLNYCFNHIEAIIHVLYRTAHESSHQE
jgi:uncharacterized protein YgfB (UPF0149 family)